MTKKVCLYEGSVFISLEGEIVFRFIRREQDRAIYAVRGFEKGNPTILIMDYRFIGLRAIDGVIQTEDDSLFAKTFANPAQITITESNAEILIELRDIDDNVQVENMLWITTCVEEPIPDYDYFFYRLQPLAGTSFALVSVFNYQQFHLFFDGQPEAELLQSQV